MSLGILEGLGALIGVDLLASKAPSSILSAGKIPPHVKLCKRIGAGFVGLSTDEIIDMVTAEAPTLKLSNQGWSKFRDDMRGSIESENVSGVPLNPGNDFQDYFHHCDGLKSTGTALYTNAEKNIPGLNTITANPIGKQLSSRAISSIPEFGGEINFALTTSPRGLINPQTGGVISQVGQQTGSEALGEAGQIAGPALAVASIVMGFKNDGVLGGIANTLSTVAYFDPEPISRVALVIVGSILGAIFAHHAAQKKLEHKVECIANQSLAEAMYSIEDAVMSGKIFPEHGCQLLDHLYDSYKGNLDKYGLVGRGSSSRGCNAGCEYLWYLSAIIIKRKDRYLHLVDAPCPPPPKVAIQAQPQTYINPAVIAANERAGETGYSGAGRRFLL